MEPQIFTKPHLLVWNPITKRVFLKRKVTQNTKVYTIHTCVNTDTEVQNLELNID